MAKFTEMDKAVAGRLRAAVRDIESLLKSAGIPRDSSSSTLLEEILSSAQKKIEGIEQLEEQSTREERDRSLRDVEIAVAVRYEAELTAAENRQYQEFMAKENFTKADFGKLENFYHSAYDRLSEDGKSEMSHRVWEGVRRKEYEFSELPDIVKEKEAKRLRNELGKEQVAPDLLNIPAGDRRDFMKAWDEGNKPRSYEVLDRPSFAANVSLSAKSVEAETVKVHEDEATRVGSSEQKNGSRPATKGNAAGIAEISLADLTLVDDGGKDATKPTVGTDQHSSSKGKNPK